MTVDASILVVYDWPRILKAVRLTLEAEGYRVLTASDGLEALDVLRAQPVDLILADIAMPRMNGYQLYERVRENPQWVEIPFIFLTARTLDSDILYGKELGVDDYLTKPVEAEGLLAAVRGRLRRARQLIQTRSPSPEQHVLTVGKLRIAAGQYRAWLGAKELQLSAKEFNLLERLAQRQGDVLSPQELIRVTHGLDADRVEAGNLVRPLIRTLRRKLGYPVGDMGCIENVHGVGYRLVVPADD